MTRRIFITIEYDGGPFVGWQRQVTGPSVQQVLEEAAADGEVPGYRYERFTRKTLVTV